MKVLIIGAGWYGCHLANYLIKKNIDFIIVDKSNDIFTGSSSKNQNRLHLGFHYPRSDNTIIECLKGYTQFIEMYPQILYNFDKNLYFISSKKSFIDIDTYINKMKSYSIKFIEYTKELPIDILNIETPILEVKEQYIDPFKATNYFKEIIHPYFRIIEDLSVFNSIENIINYFNTNFDLVINCTYNALNPIEFTH